MVEVRWVIALVGLLACSGTASNPRPTHPAGTENQMTKREEGTTVVIDGKQVSFSELQARLGELSMEPKPTSTANLEEPDGSFGGTEEHYIARSKANGDVYHYMIVRSPTHHHHELTLQARGSEHASEPRPPATNTSWTLDGRTVDQRTFEQLVTTLEIDAEPWINKHLTDTSGSSGTSATFEARDRKTGERWTYVVQSVGGRSARSLSRGSRKQSTPARQ